MAKKPTGFVATCICGSAVGAMDLGRTEPKDASRILGKWLMSGCTVSPRFDRQWSAQLVSCACPATEDKPHG